MTNKKKLLENIISLLILQGSNYIIPLIIFPYLVRVIGEESYGIISAASAFIGYFIVCSDYGFNITATREIAVNRDNPKKVSEIFSTVMFTKFFIMVFGFIIMVIIVYSIEKVRTEWPVYLVTYITVLGNVLFPIWFFQGIEKMRYITIFNLVARALSVLGIFIFVNEQSDYLIAALIQSFGSLVPGIISFWVIKRNFQFKLVKFQMIIDQLKKGFSIFLSGISIISYTSYNTVIVGLFLGPKEVGIFSISFKLIQVFTSLTQPILQAFLPYLSTVFNKSVEEGRKLTYKVTFFLILFNLLITVGILLFIEPTVNLVFGDVSKETIKYVKLMSLLPLITTVAYIFINILMLNEGIIKYSMYIYFAAGLLNVISGPIVLRNGNLTSLVYLYVIIELFITLMAIYVYLKMRWKCAIKHNYIKL